MEIKIKMYKKQLFTLMFSSLTFVSTFAVELQTELDTFKNTCFENEQIVTDAKIPNANQTCEEYAIYLESKLSKIDSSENTAPSVEEASDVSLTCDPDGESLETVEVNNLIEEANNITARMACLKEEVEANQKICGKLFQCNVMRSISSATDTILPDMLSSKIDKALAGKVSTSELPKDCLDKSKGDCLTEVVTSFIGNLWSTVTSVWDLVKAGTSSLFNVSSWFDKKADAAHTAAVQTESDVKKFASDPASFIMDKFKQFTNVVDEWVKGSVFCQKWAGAPHLSECKIPLQNYDCIDCDHKINATCAAIGTLTSEVGLLVMTAGVGNVASITARVGARALAVAAREAAINIKRVTPGLNVGKAVNKSETLAKVAKVTKTAVVATKNAVVTTAKVIKDGKDLVSDYMMKLSDLKLVRSSLHVVDFATNPLGASKSLSRLGVNMSNKVLTQVGSKTARRHAKISLLMDKHYDNKKIVKTVIDKRDDHALRNSSIKGSRIASHVGSSHKPRTTSGSGAGNSKRERDLRGSADHEITAGSGHTQDNKKQGNQQAIQQQQQQQQQPGQRNHTTVETSNNRQQSNSSGGNSHASLEHKKENKKGLDGANLLGAFAIADVAGKVSGSSESAAESTSAFTSEAAARKLLNEQGAPKSKEQAAREALGANSISSMKKNAEKLSEIYDDGNKAKMVDQLVQNTGVTREVASQIFDQRKNEVIEAKKYVDNLSGEKSDSSAFSSKSNSTISESEELKKAMSMATKSKNAKVFDVLDEKREQLEEKLKSLDSKYANSANEEAQSQAVSSGRRSVGAQRNLSSTGGSFLATGSSSRSQSNTQAVQNSNVEQASTPENNPLLRNVLAMRQGEGQAEAEDVSTETQSQVKKVDVESAEKTYQVTAVRNLLRVVNQENVDLVNDALIEGEVQLASDKLDQSYIEKARKYIDAKAQAKYKITKLLGASKKVDVYEFDNGEQFSIFTNDGKSQLISNEDSEGYFTK